MRAAIRGIGAVGAFGAGRPALLEALGAGSVTPTTVSLPAEGGAIDVRALLADSSPLERFVDKRLLRRTDHLSRLALLASHLALEDAGVTPPGGELGVALATGYGGTRTTFAFLDSFLRDGDTGSSPTLFSSSVHNAPAATVSMLMGITGPNLTVSQFELSVPSALLTALTWLAEKRARWVLVGGLDEWGEMLGYCWWRFFGAGEGPIRPLELGRQTAVPGEGAAVLLLTADDGTPSPYGFIEEVRLGRGEETPVEIPAEAVLVLGADGQRLCGEAYADAFPHGPEALSWSPAWGSFPTGMAFDLAAAAAVLGENRLPGAPSVSIGNRPLVVARMSQGGGYALVTLRR